MNCCIKCFTAEEIKSMIRSMENKGDCEICNSKNVFVYNMDTDKGLDTRFNDILSIYREKDELEDDFPPNKLVMIKNDFQQGWNIFNNKLDVSQIYDLLYTLLSKNYPEQLVLLDDTVGIPEYTNKQYLAENSLLKNYSWEEFVDFIKHSNRFHTNHINYHILNYYLERMSNTIEVGNLFYRARISNDEELNVGDMGAPPTHKTTAGRANSEGISHLYLASDIMTSISETRPSIGDNIYIGEFQVSKRLKVIDFRKLDKISAFDFEEVTMFAININNFKKMKEEISKPVRSGDSKLDYLPTQFIVDYIKSLKEDTLSKYDGIIYESTLSNSGYNVMIFNPQILNCRNVCLKEIYDVNYSHKNGDD